jgi:hypothetical protein
MFNSSNGAPASIESLIAPCPLEQFFAEHWRQRHLHLRGSSATAFASLLEVAELDALFGASAGSPEDWFFYRSIDRVEQSAYLGRDGQIQLNSVYALYREGGTIHLRNVQRRQPSIERLWRSLTHAFRTQVRVNLWVTSGNDFTPFLHYDTHDIFILQLHGTKRWTLYPRNAALFAPRSGSTQLARQDVGVALDPITIGPGDLLYVPAGQPHEVTTLDPHSVHLAIGVHPVLWRDVLEVALAELDRRGSSLTDIVPTHLLRPGAGAELRAALAGQLGGSSAEIDGDKLIDHLEARFVMAAPAPQDGHFARELLAEAPVHPSSLLRRRAAAPAVVTEDPRSATVRIFFPSGGHMEGPVSLASTLRRIATAEAELSAHDLPDDLDLPSRTLLLDELLRRGFLERAS